MLMSYEGDSSAVSSDILNINYCCVDMKLTTEGNRPIVR